MKTHTTELPSPPPPLRVCPSIHTQGNSCSNDPRMLVLNDPHMWRMFHWSVGLAGFLLCTTLAFVIKWYFAFLAIAALGALAGGLLMSTT